MPYLRHPAHTHRPDPHKLQARVNRWTLAAIAVGCILWAIGWMFVANAAERTTPGPHEITLLFDGADLEKVSRSFFTLSGPYADKQGCEKAKTGLVVMVKGARLRCDPVNPFRVN